MCMKLSFRILNSHLCSPHPTSYTCRVKTPSFSSHAWKSIMEGRDDIRKGGLWRIGDGRSISFWRDNWIPVKHRPKIVSPIQNMDIG